MQIATFVLFSLLCCTVGQPKQTPATVAPLTAAPRQQAASFEKGRPVVGTTYFYWYDVESKAHIVDHDGSDALTTHPADMEGISYKRVPWHKGQLRDMMDAGIDFLMPVYWGVPGQYDGWSFVGLPPLVEAHTELEKEGLTPPAIGLFYDTSILQWNRSSPDDSSYHVDLTTERGREWFYAAIREFFRRIPPAKWARVDGKPIVFFYEAAFAKKQDPARQFEHVKTRFRADFGVEPFLVKSSGWEGEADAVYSWGGAVQGPILFRDVAALGPGYDHSAVPGRQPLIVKRQDGRTYIDRWMKLLQLDPKVRPWMVHVETWNEWHEGTDIAHSREYGRSYVVLTRLFADLWHAGTHLNLPSSFINANSVIWEPDRPRGLDLRPSGGDGNWELRAFDGIRAAVTLPNPHSRASRYLYFNVDDAFAYGLMGRPLSLRLRYRDAGGPSLAVEYDSTVPEGPRDGAFRPAGSQAVVDSGSWKTAEFRLPDCRFMNRCNGADLRLVVAGGTVELSVSMAELWKVD
ncbi:MAG: DUF5010 domain-containing protein [Planctomycetes bacterium]|jgi:hypothetical protein|nr:DUF5010 domain-containing protein [Planctomycetota bacterium]